ncbi:MAG TPA: cobalamin biosynthesis protein [Methanothermobacter sp.]|nr:cobalamin biosynthesis protein [Methanothermobacter sp.]HOL68894.1 cobalamin biosynthesis protein [Methanothermobacter sp.]HPQ04967.1 cobalamin biosynthesis protein [Methanothermobacter sp.]HPU37111.1 cobalamin biosynthesis protein [Methanothermobacter sp.]
MEIFIIGILIDVILGEPPVYLHPVVWMGKITENLKGKLGRRKISGIILTFILFSAFIIPLSLIEFLPWLFKMLLSSFLFSTTISIKFLFQSIIKAKNELEKDIEMGRRHISKLVSRDTSKLTREQLTSALIESLTENITDSIISPIIFFILFGLPGAMGYRVINTLDAMVGYKDEENRSIGWFPARADDILNYIPARITGFLIVIAAFILRMDWKDSLKLMLRDGKLTPSPNSGYPMAAAAGALQIALEKPGVYKIGDENNKLNTSAIDDALKLSYVTVALFILPIIILGVLT